MSDDLKTLVGRAGLVVEELRGVLNEMARLSYEPLERAAASNKPKLSKREAKTIRRMQREGWTQAGLAEIFDVNPATISRIVRGHYWK